MSLDGRMTYRSSEEGLRLRASHKGCDEAGKRRSDKVTSRGGGGPVGGADEGRVPQAAPPSDEATSSEEETGGLGGGAERCEGEGSARKGRRSSRYKKQYACEVSRGRGREQAKEEAREGIF